MPLVNGHQADTGCYVEGHWGQYGPDHLADQAAAFGWEPESWADDPRVLRSISDTLENMGYTDAAFAIHELAIGQGEATDKIEEWLNDHTPDDQHVGMRLREPGPGLEPVTQSYLWHWHDGEFFLSPWCGGDDENCEDETCAHWD